MRSPEIASCAAIGEKVVFTSTLEGGGVEFRYFGLVSSLVKEGLLGNDSVYKSGSGKLRDRSADALGTNCPKTSLLLRSQVTDYAGPEFPDLDAHKQVIVGKPLPGFSTRGS